MMKSINLCALAALLKCCAEAFCRRPWRQVKRSLIFPQISLMAFRTITESLVKWSQREWLTSPKLIVAARSRNLRVCVRRNTLFGSAVPLARTLSQTCPNSLSRAKKMFVLLLFEFARWPPLRFLTYKLMVFLDFFYYGFHPASCVDFLSIFFFPAFTESFKQTLMTIDGQNN